MEMQTKPKAKTDTDQMTGAEIVITALKEQGVEVMFGYPGGAVLPIYDALFTEPSIRHVLVRHEQGAKGVAGFYRRRKDSRRRFGFRHQLTTLSVVSIG